LAERIEEVNYKFGMDGDQKQAVGEIDTKLIPDIATTYENAGKSKEAKFQIATNLPYGVRGGTFLYYFDREAAKKDMDKAQSVYYLLLGDDASATKAAQGDAELLKILDMIKADREGLTNDAFLEEMHTTKGDFYFTIGDLLKAGDPRDEGLLKAAEDQYKNAQRSWKDSTDMRSRVRVAEADIAISEVNILRAKNYMKAGDYANALKKSDEAINSLTDKDLLKLLIDNKAEKDILKLSANLAWAYGVKGGLNEDLHGDGTGKNEFLTAASIYTAIAYGQVLKKDMPEQAQPVIATLISLRESLCNEETLESIELSQAKIHLTLAELLKSAGGDTLSPDSPAYLDEAQKEYKAALELYKPDPQSKFFMRRKTEMGEANVGLAESFVIRGKIRELNNEMDAADKDYRKAIKMLADVVSDHNDNAKLNLKAILSFAWATSAADGLKEASLHKQLKGQCDNYYLFSSVIYRSLIENPSALKGLEWSKVIKTAEASAKKDYGVDLKPALKMIDDRRADMKNPVVLDELDTSETSIKLNYILSLVSAKKYDEARNAFEPYKKLLRSPNPEKPLPVREQILLVTTAVAIGDALCWKEQKYERAKDYYQGALAYSQKLGDFTSVGYSDISAHLGLAQIYAKEGQVLPRKHSFDRAVGEYNTILGIIKKKEEDLNAENKDLKNKDKLLRAKAYIGLGNLYNYNMRDKKTAADAYKKAMDEANNYQLITGQKKLKALTLLGMGDMERMLNRNNEAAVKDFEAAKDQVSDVDDQEAAKIRAKIDNSKAASLRKDWKGGLDYDGAIELYKMAEDELDGVCGDDAEAKKIRRQRDKELTDTYVDRAKKSGFGAGFTQETESSEHKDTRTNNLGEKENYTTKSKMNWSKVNVQVPFAKRFNLGIEMKSATPDIKTKMPASNLVDLKDLDKNKWIPEKKGDYNPDTDYYIPMMGDVSRQDIKDQAAALSGENITLQNVKQTNETNIDLSYEKDLGKFSIAPKITLGINSVKTEFTEAKLANYPYDLQKKSSDSNFQSTNLGFDIPIKRNIDLFSRYFPSSFTFDVGANALSKNMSYGAFPMDEAALNSQIDTLNNSITGNNKMIGALEKGIEDANRMLTDPKITLKPEERTHFQGIFDGYTEEKTHITELNNKQSKDLDTAKNTLKDLKKNDPLYSYHLQGVWSATLPLENLGIENKTLGYGPTFNLGAMWSDDQITPTWNGYWRPNKDYKTQKLQGLIGLGNTFYLPYGIVAPVSFSTTLPLWDKENSKSYNATADFMFTKWSSRGLTPAAGIYYNNYSDDQNKSQIVGGYLRVYINK